MKVDLEMMKDQQGNHFLLVKIGTVDGQELTSYIPMNLDPLYLLYKKITTEFHHFDATINQAGLDFKAQEAAKAEADANGLKEQDTVAPGAPQTAENN